MSAVDNTFALLNRTNSWEATQYFNNAAIGAGDRLYFGSATPTGYIEGISNYTSQVKMRFRIINFNDPYNSTPYLQATYNGGMAVGTGMASPSADGHVNAENYLINGDDLVSVSAGASGYQKVTDTDGEVSIIQWGVVTGTNQAGGQTFSFPIAFPTACRSVVVQPTVNLDPVRVSAATTSNFTVKGNGVGDAFTGACYYIAMGN